MLRYGWCWSCLSWSDARYTSKTVAVAIDSANLSVTSCGFSLYSGTNSNRVFVSAEPSRKSCLRRQNLYDGCRFLSSSYANNSRETL
ncbi:hypothetical protein BKA63DRAFT_61271 [Paraphoma chrysanthemicola]|nr:hypothetical protein BKA63DRAFT_61271 [Paraphoma chrysanthemicola]